KRGLGDSCNDCRLAAQMPGSRLKISLRFVYDSRRIFDSNELGPEFLQINFGAAQARQNKRLLAGDKVSAVKFCGDLNGQFAALKSFRCVFCIRSGGQEISPKGYKDSDTSSVHSFDCLHSVETVFFGRCEVELLAQRREKFRAYFFPD